MALYRGVLSQLKVCCVAHRSLPFETASLHSLINVMSLPELADLVRKDIIGETFETLKTEHAILKPEPSCGSAA